MFCSKCGNEIPEGDLFCSRCGNSVNGLEEKESKTSGRFIRDLKVLGSTVFTKPMQCLDKAKEFGTEIVVFLTIMVSIISSAVLCGYMSRIMTLIGKLIEKVMSSLMGSALGSSYGSGYGSGFGKGTGYSSLLPKIDYTEQFISGVISKAIIVLVSAAVIMFIVNIIFKRKAKFIEYLKVVLIANTVMISWEVLGLIVSFISPVLSLLMIVIAGLSNTIITYNGVKKIGDFCEDKAMYSIIAVESILLIINYIVIFYIF